MSENRLRLMAEWEPQERVLLTLPDKNTDWAYMLDEVWACYSSIIRCLSSYGVPVTLFVRNTDDAVSLFDGSLPDGVTTVVMSYNDTWIRDYGPLSIEHVRGGEPRRRLLADFGFNGWGLKFASCDDNLVNARYFGCNTDGIFNPEYLNCRGYELEGGSVETDGRGTLLTTSSCLCSPNRNGGLSRGQAERTLSRLLGIDHFLWLDHGYLAGDDTDGHIDTLARICPGDVIIYVGCQNPDDEHYAELAVMKRELETFKTRDGHKYNLVELPLPSAIFDPEDGHRLPATYANYLVTDRVVLVPSYGQQHEDDLAAGIIQSVYSDRAVKSIDCRALIRQHGSLHCATMQINK